MYIYIYIEGSFFPYLCDEASDSITRADSPNTLPSYLWRRFAVGWWGVIRVLSLQIWIDTVEICRWEASGNVGDLKKGMSTLAFETVLEECDDNNNLAGDGCGADCKALRNSQWRPMHRTAFAGQVEIGWFCIRTNDAEAWVIFPPLRTLDSISHQSHAIMLTVTRSWTHWI